MITTERGLSVRNLFGTIEQGKGLSSAYPTVYLRNISDRAGGCSVQIRQGQRTVRCISDRACSVLIRKGGEVFGTTRQGRGLSGAYPTGHVRYLSERAGRCSVQPDRAGDSPVYMPRGMFDTYIVSL